MVALQIAWITVAGFALLGASPAIAGTFYSITPLPFQPADLNNSGEVVGQQYLWRSGTLFDIRTFPGASDTTLNARGINDNGWIVGDGLRSDRSAPFFDIANNRGFVFNGQDITPISPTTFTTPTTRTIATDVNNQNQVLVNEQLVNATGVIGVPVRLEPDGSRTPLFQTARFGAVDARAINNRGQAIGTSLSSGRTGPGAAYLSDGTITTPLISSGYCSTFIDFIVPRCEQGVTNPPQPIVLGLNDRGQVVGAGSLIRANQAPIRALIWEDPVSNPFGEDLGSFGRVSEGLQRNVESIANGINSSGDIVGYAYAPDGERRAVLWQNGQLIDLNDQSVLDSSWKLTEALQINDAGQIIGIGSFNGQQTGFLLSPEPIPEPSQVLGTIAGAGMFLACFLRKRRGR